MMHLSIRGAGVLGLLVAAQGVSAQTATITSPAKYQREAVVNNTNGSFVSGGTDSTRITFGPGVESRGVYEFAIPTVPTGATLGQATLNYYVNYTNTGPIASSQLQFFASGGDGIYNTSDNNPGLSVGLSPLLKTLGAYSTPMDQSVMDGVYSGAKFVSLVAWQESSGLTAGLARGGTFSPAPTMSFQVNVPTAGTLGFKPTFDVEASKSGTNFVADGVTDSIVTQDYAFANIDRRGVQEYDLTLLPDNAVITTATLSFKVDLISGSGPNGGPSPLVYGYLGNGTYSEADAQQITNLLATGTPVASPGAYTITLDAAKLNALLASGDTLGILIRGSANSNQFGYSSLEGGYGATLNLTYVPEPAGLAVLLLGVPALMRRRKTR